jgi:hypothetical protein
MVTREQIAEAHAELDEARRCLDDLDNALTGCRLMGIATPSAQTLRQAVFDEEQARYEAWKALLDQLQSEGTSHTAECTRYMLENDDGCICGAVNRK